MDCSIIRNKLFRYLDNELSSEVKGQLDSHLARCAACARELRVLTLPGRIARAVPAPEPSPYFFQKIHASLEAEARNIPIWQIIVALSHRLVPAMAAVTLALLLTFGYLQFQSPATDIAQAYDSILTSGERQSRMVIADQAEITDESVLRSMAEDETSRQPVPGSESIRGK